MTLLLALVTALLLALLLFTGIGKYARITPIRHNMNASDVPKKHWSRLATLEMLGALGLLVGWLWRPIGILTSGCLIAYFSGAVAAHLKAGDKNIAPSGSGAVMAAIALVLFLRRNRNPVGHAVARRR